MAFPAGALGIWLSSDFVSSPRKTIPNSVINGTTDSNLLFAPRRAFSITGPTWQRANVTVVDANVTAPDGTSDASTVTSAPNVVWIIQTGTVQFLSGTYTAAISVKSLSGGNADFKFGDASDLFTATTSWQRFTKTFTLGSPGANIKLQSPDGVTAANFAICDFEVFSGSSDLNLTALSAAPLSVQNSDIVIGTSQFGSDAVSGGFFAHGAQGFIQLPVIKDTSAYTIIYVSKATGTANTPGSDPIIAKPDINGTLKWHDFAVGPSTFSEVGSFVNNTTIDKTPAGGSITQTGDNNLWLPSNHGPAVYAHRYDGAQASAFINGAKLLDNAVVVSAKTFLELYVGVLSGISFTGSDIYALGYWPSALTDLEVRQATAEFASRISLASTRIIIFDGSSITQGAGFIPYSATISPNLSPRVFGVNYAVGGSSLGTLTGRANGVDAAISGAAGAGSFILSVEAGVNDLGNLDFGGNPNGFLAALSAYHDARRTAGWKTVAHTVLARRDAGDGGAQFESDRTIVNAGIRTWRGVHCDAIADWAADPTMGTFAAPLDTSLFDSQKLHPTTLGHTFLEPITRAAINSIDAVVQTGPGGIITSHTFTRKRWKELKAELEAKERSLKKRSDRKSLIDATKAAEIAIQDSELASQQQKEAIQADVERMESALKSAARARSVAIIIEQANKAAKLAEAIRLQLDDDEEEEALAMLLLDS